MLYVANIFISKAFIINNILILLPLGIFLFLLPPEQVWKNNCAENLNILILIWNEKLKMKRTLIKSSTKHKVVQYLYFYQK